MYGCELDHKEGWVPKNWCFQTMVLENTPLDSKKIKPVNPRGNQPWIFIRRTDCVAEAPILWPPDSNSCLIGKDPAAGKNWGQEKAAREDEMVGRHYWLNGHEFEQTQGNSERQTSLACCSSWSHSQTWLSNWTTAAVHIKNKKPENKWSACLFKNHIQRKLNP